MSISLQLHHWIDQNNLLKSPTKKIHAYMMDRRDIYKVVLIANHFFRAFSMAGALLVLHCPFWTKAFLCFSASLIYRLTVETNCAYKFALPSFAGSIALPMGKEGAALFINRAAFSSLKTFAEALGSLAFFSLYATYVILTVDYDVDRK
jgi:hypothetical protein